jgi:hypothetical protein
MFAAATVGASHPAVAALLGLGAAVLAAVVVAMAWSVHVRQIRLAEQLARRQFIVTGEQTGQTLNGHGPAQPEAQEPREAPPQGTQKAARGAATARPAKLAIDGPDTVVAGEQVRYRVRPAGNGNMVTWAAGGGAVSQYPDPAHPDEMLLVADRPGTLMVSVRVREGLTERRETKAVTAVPEVAASSPPFTLRLFLHGWGLVVVAILIVGFAGALDALGTLTSADFIALVVPLAALLGVIAVARGTPDAGARPGRGQGRAGPET